MTDLCAPRDVTRIMDIVTNLENVSVRLATMGLCVTSVINCWAVVVTDTVTRRLSAGVSQAGRGCSVLSPCVGRDVMGPGDTATNQESAGVGRDGRGPPVTSVYQHPAVTMEAASYQGSAPVTRAGEEDSVTCLTVGRTVTRTMDTVTPPASAGAGWDGRGQGVTHVYHTQAVSMVSVGTQSGSVTVRQDGLDTSVTR